MAAKELCNGGGVARKRATVLEMMGGGQKIVVILLVFAEGSIISLLLLMLSRILLVSGKWPAFGKCEMRLSAGRRASEEEEAVSEDIFLSAVQRFCRWPPEPSRPAPDYLGALLLHHRADHGLVTGNHGERMAVQQCIRSLSPLASQRFPRR